MLRSIIRICSLRWFYVLDHLKARDCAARHWIFVCVLFSITIFGASQSVSGLLLIQKPQKEKNIKNQTKPPKIPKRNQNNLPKTKWTLPEMLCACMCCPAAPPRQIMDCLLVVNDALFPSLNQWHWCFSAFDGAVIVWLFFLWWWFVSFGFLF